MVEKYGENVEFIPLILVAKDIIGVDAEPLLDMVNMKEFRREKEITTFDYNYKITKLSTYTKKGKTFYLANVKQIK